MKHCIPFTDARVALSEPGLKEIKEINGKFAGSVSFSQAFQKMSEFVTLFMSISCATTRSTLGDCLPLPSATTIRQTPAQALHWRSDLNFTTQVGSSGNDWLLSSASACSTSGATARSASALHFIQRLALWKKEAP
eukprot:CAMPEP_0197700666 /NCGR_PEP_ID=MMETSP1338-20131121/122252_1 /TAXON_ID=43686 ORGANISM="Pelagodinium beii, Strain RCC1491" /NCGR_SAMPLE_ID=MMETSP1338 /ASSEMBLY_ACC=CAM_ASM_000754 /LENGTH=135 /DNA_ID=CAMNT_0043284301 /DNA_START=63 /DNA_END=468 /DNA_ORIENTATION=-